jgi:ketosteroid isomerase-like protein
MSQENVETMRAVFEAWNAGDMDAFRDLHTPTSGRGARRPEPGPFVGRDVVMRQFEQLRETWDLDVVEPISDFIDVTDRVVVRSIWHGVGHGPEAGLEMTAIVTVRQGRRRPARSAAQRRRERRGGTGSGDGSSRVGRVRPMTEV